MKYKFSIENIEDLNVKECNIVFGDVETFKGDVYNELNINKRKYFFLGDYECIPFEKDNLLVVNMWHNLVFFSSKGNLLFFSGLSDSLIGINSLEKYFLIVTDTTFFKVNKNLFFSFDFNSFPYNILDYEISENFESIRLIFVEEEMQEDIIVDL